MSINNVEIQDSTGNVYYPHTDSAVVKFGETDVKSELDTINSGLVSLNNNLAALGESVADGKSLIASAITSKGVSTASDATFETMATNIGNTSQGKIYTINITNAGNICTFNLTSIPKYNTLNLSKMVIQPNFASIYRYKTGWLEFYSDVWSYNASNGILSHYFTANNEIDGDITNIGHSISSVKIAVIG